MDTKVQGSQGDPAQSAPVRSSKVRSAGSSAGLRMPFGTGAPRKPHARRKKSAGSATGAVARLHGVNLAGWLIVEPWITPSLFSSTGASNEHELAQKLGLAQFNERLRQHYETFITEGDFRRMSAIGLNSVRIPVPWHVFGAQTDEATHMPCTDYLDRAMEWAEKYGMSVLIDLATVPGGQGDSSTSPATPSSPAEWHSAINGRQAALDAVGHLAERYGEAKALYGIELLDAPQVSARTGLFSHSAGIPAHYLRNYYRDAYELLRARMPESKAVVFSDSGHPSLWKPFMRGGRYTNVVMDVHLYHYRNDTAQDITAPNGIPDAIRRNGEVIREAIDAGFPVIVGEWSAAAVLSETSITPEGRRAYERVFVSNQLASFSPAAGWYFQTWKTERRLSAWDARVALAPLERKMME